MNEDSELQSVTGHTAAARRLSFEFFELGDLQAAPSQLLSLHIDSIIFTGKFHPDLIVTDDNLPLETKMRRH